MLKSLAAAVDTARLRVQEHHAAEAAGVPATSTTSGRVLLEQEPRSLQPLIVFAAFITAGERKKRLLPSVFQTPTSASDWPNLRGSQLKKESKKCSLQASSSRLYRGGQSRMRTELEQAHKWLVL